MNKIESRFVWCNSYCILANAFISYTLLMVIASVSGIAFMIDIASAMIIAIMTYILTECALLIADDKRQRQ